MTLETSPPSETILLVEDEVLIRLVIAEYLRGCGYKVVEASSADEALTVLGQVDIDIDVVFSDIEMPGSMDGFELSKWLRTHRPTVDVILTGSVTHTTAAAAKLCDSGPLTKPYEPQTAAERIKQLMAMRATRKK